MRSRCQRLRHSLGILRRDPQKRACWPFRSPTTLLPVLQCCHTHADHQSEFLLRFLKFAANRTHIFRPKLSHPSGLQLPSANGSCLLDACHQTIKVLLFHLNSSLTSRRMIAICLGVRSSWSFLLDVLCEDGSLDKSHADRLRHWRSIGNIPFGSSTINWTARPLPLLPAGQGKAETGKTRLCRSDSGRYDKLPLRRILQRVG